MAARVDVDDRSSERGRHLVDLLADGLGQPTGESARDDPYLRYAYTLGGVAFALLFTAVMAAILS